MKDNFNKYFVPGSLHKHEWEFIKSNILKYNILRMGNTITQIPLQKTSLSQLTTSMAIMIDKLRLLEGKSTANISTQILHSLNPEQLNIIQESIKSLKKSMLNVE